MSAQEWGPDPWPPAASTCATAPLPCGCRYFTANGAGSSEHVAPGLHAESNEQMPWARFHIYDQPGGHYDLTLTERQARGLRDYLNANLGEVSG